MAKVDISDGNPTVEDWENESAYRAVLRQIGTEDERIAHNSIEQNYYSLMPVHRGVGELGEREATIRVVEDLDALGDIRNGVLRHDALGTIGSNAEQFPAYKAELVLRDEEIYKEATSANLDLRERFSPATQELGRENAIDAEIGKQYNGPILGVSSDRVYQLVGDGVVAHERSMLAGRELDGYEGGSDGKPVEIRYPQGDVGIVMPEREQAIDGQEKAKNYDAGDRGMPGDR